MKHRKPKKMETASVSRLKNVMIQIVSTSYMDFAYPTWIIFSWMFLITKLTKLYTLKTYLFKNVNPILIKHFKTKKDNEMH